MRQLESGNYSKEKYFSEVSLDPTFLASTFKFYQTFIVFAFKFPSSLPAFAKAVALFNF
jgi:hypothetical protein